MRILNLLVGAALLCVAVNCNAQTYGTMQPNYYGGYNVQTHGPNGYYSTSTIQPNYYGGYNVQTNGSNGYYSTGTIQPNYYGGYNVRTMPLFNH
jgi:hypothetical protein